MIRSELPSTAMDDRAAGVHAPLRTDMSNAAPVFLHTGWRTRGTWLWSRFRALPGTACFYEPLAEELASISQAAIASHDPGNWPSGHPPLHQPYFSEFRPLLRTVTRGVVHYDTKFAVAGFFAEPDAPMPGLRDYLDLLLRTAYVEGAQPVLKFCRSVGRIGWMQRNFPQALHIVLMRNPLAQFISAQRQYRRHDNLYFLAMPLLLLTMHRDVPAVAAAVRHLAVTLPAPPRGASLRAGLAACKAHLRSSEPAAQYRAFLAFWMVTAASIPDTIDLVIDSDLLTSAEDYRRQCEIDLATLTGRTVTLGEAPAESSRDAGVVATSGLGRAALWQAHTAAEAFLAEYAGDAWADSPMLARVGAMLSYATLLGTSPLHASGLGPAVQWDAICTEAAALAADARRGVIAEQRLAAVYGSHSWKMTAPLRWLSGRLPGLARVI